MKITNEQKQLLRKYEIKFNKNTSYEKAKKLIENKELEIKNEKPLIGDAEGSNLFDRWLED